MKSVIFNYFCVSTTFVALCSHKISSVHQLLLSWGLVLFLFKNQQVRKLSTQITTELYANNTEIAHGLKTSIVFPSRCNVCPSNDVHESRDLNFLRTHFVHVTALFLPNTIFKQVWVVNFLHIPCIISLNIYTTIILNT